MAGRSIDLKKTLPMVEMAFMHDFNFGTWGLEDIQDATKNDKDLETYEGDVIDRCSDTPCCFTPGPIRSYVVRHLPIYFDRPKEPRPAFLNYEYLVVSAYKPFLENVYVNSVYDSRLEKYHYTLFTNHCNITFAILMIADGTFAGAIYTGGKMNSKEIVTRKSLKTSKSEKTDFRQRVSDLLQEWRVLPYDSASNFTFVRCTYDDKVHFFENLGNTGDSRFRHIPFVTGKPTLREVDRVYDRLTRCVIHDDIDNTLKELWNQKRTIASSLSEASSNPETNRRLEKKMWPWMDPSLAQRLVGFVESDDGDGLYDEVQAHSKKPQLIEYLNSDHEKFNHGSFLHFAVQKQAESVVAILLELGCDPTSSDAKNNVPFDYCKTTDMQEVFIEFRSLNPELFNWNKAKVSEKSEIPVHNERKKEVESPNKNDFARKKRSEKLKKKNIKNYE